jgi:hypothetical protein
MVAWQKGLLLHFGYACSRQQMCKKALWHERSVVSVCLRRSSAAFLSIMPVLACTLPLLACAGDVHPDCALGIV